MNQILKQIYNQIITAQHILLVTHQNPDGDAVGSVSAMSHFLQKINKPHQTYCVHNTPEKLKKYPHIIDLQNDIQVWSDESIDLIIIMDCGDLKYAGIEEFVKKITHSPMIINIDHHNTNKKFGHINLVVSQASSTTEILYNFFKKNNLPITKQISFCLLIGLITDTENFTNPGTNSQSLSIASHLIENGANFNLIKNIFIKNKSINILKLWGEIFYRLDKHEATDIVYTYVTQKDLQEKNLTDNEVEGIANFLNNLEEGKACLVLKELTEGKVKGSFRTTRDDVDVSTLAQLFGGGGHKKAAGFTMEGDIQEVIKKIWETLQNKIK